MVIITACYECPDRKLGCHGSCQKYQEEKKAKEEMRQTALGLKHGCKDADDYEIRRTNKIQKSMKRR